MRLTLPLFVVVAIATETVENGHELRAARPHVEPEIKVSKATRVTQPSASGGAGSGEAPGTFRGRVFHRNMLRSRRRGKFGMFDAYADTARAVVQEYPNMERWQRNMHYSCLRSQIGMTARRTRRDDSAVLPLIAQVLGVEI